MPDLNLLQRGTFAAASFASHRPRVVLLGTLLLVLASIAYASEHLTYKSQRNDLISSKKECQKRWQRMLDAFGEDDDFVFVIRGHDRAAMTAAVDALESKLQGQPQFDRVFAKIDLRNLQSRSLQYASVAELKIIDAKLDEMAPLLGPLSPVAWHALSLESMLVRADSAKPSDAALRSELPAIVQAARKSLETLEAAPPIWQNARANDDRLAKPHYFFTPDSKLAYVLARPRNASDSLTNAQAACEAARRIVAETREKFPSLEFGLTGLPVLETDEMAASDEDSTTASWLALGGVVLLYAVVYRGFRYPILTIVSLLVGTFLALGWAALTVGHLNILSATFAVMLIGMGDYGVIWVSHYDDRRRSGANHADAQAHTALHAGPGILTASLTAALAFAATMTADFLAVAELGWIAGCGILFCSLVCITVLPAMLALLEWYKPRAVEVESAAPFLPVLSSRPRSVIAVTIAFLAVMVAGAMMVHYDANLLNMQARGLDSVAWEEELIRHSAGTTWDALSLASSREEALALKAKYEALPVVKHVAEAASLIPADYDAKRPILLSIHRKLAGLQPTVPDFSLATAESVRLASERVAGTEVLRNAIAKLPPETATLRLRAFDTRLRRELHADLSHLKAVCEPGRIGVDDLPPAFRERFIAANGTYLVRAFANESLWDDAALERFTASARTADPEATGKSFRTLEGLEQMKSGFLRAGIAAFIVIVFVLAFDLRSIRDVLLGLLPLACGLIATLGILGGLGVPLNPANLIALPLIVGVGVDNGVHVLHDYRERDPHEPYCLHRATGRGIAVAALTTILGFGTLMIARHRGMAGLGLALTLGVSACMIASLVVLPAVLRLQDTALQIPQIKLHAFLSRFVRG